MQNLISNQQHIDNFLIFTTYLAGRDISHDDYSYTEDMDYSNGFDAHSTLSDISTNRKYEPQLVPQLDEFDSGTIETGSGASKLMEIFETKSSSGATIRLDADDTASSLLTQLQDDDLFKSFVVEQKKSNWVCKYCKIQNDQVIIERIFLFVIIFLQSNHILFAGPFKVRLL